MEVSWLQHRRSGVRLRVDARLLAFLQTAAVTSGPLEQPQRVSRFLSMLAGWQEARGGESLGDDVFAVLGRPRGELVSAATVQDLESGGARYGRA